MIIDDEQNGWRRLVLPLAFHDTLVKDAVVVVSACSFSIHIDEQLFKPNILYQKAIHKLRETENISALDPSSLRCVVLALLLLLAADMVTTSPDFRIVFRCLDSLLSAAGDAAVFADDEMGRFLFEQVQKYRSPNVCSTSADKYQVSWAHSAIQIVRRRHDHPNPDSNDFSS